MEEIWKDVPMYEERYKVSNYGNVMSYVNGKHKQLKGSISNKGYVQFSLNWKERGLYNVYGGHVLVAMAFLNHKPKSTIGYVVDHKDDNKMNNILSNLQLLSNRDNSTKNGSSSKYFGVHVCKNKFAAIVWYNKKTVYLGLYKTEIEAHESVMKYLRDNKIKRLV